MFDILSYFSEINHSYEWVNKRNISFDCPFCGKSDQHFTVSIDEGNPVYNCYRCSAHGNWVGLVAHFSRISYDEADNMVNGLNFFIPSINPEHSEQISYKQVELPTKSSWTLRSKQYLESRGLSDSEIRDRGMYYCTEWPYAERIIIPIYWDGKPVCFQARTIRDKNPKYMTMKGSDIGNYVYGEIGEEVIACEGVFDAIRIQKTGLNGIAMFGAKVGERQISLLKEGGCERLVLCFDDDKMDSINWVWESLIRYFDVSVIPIFQGDPGDMSSEDITNAYENRVSDPNDFIKLRLERMKKEYEKRCEEEFTPRFQNC